MPFDNAKFTAWLIDFERGLKESGMPERQARKYRGEFYNEAVGHFAAGRTADEAVVLELLGMTNERDHIASLREDNAMLRNR